MFKLLLMVVTVSLFFTVPAPFSRSHWIGAYLKFGSQEPNNMIDLSNENENHHTTAAVCVCVCLFHSKLNECIKKSPPSSFIALFAFVIGIATAIPIVIVIANAFFAFDYLYCCCRLVVLM